METKIYDVAVIGGGIAGAAIARDAALRGLSVILFEKNTFGSGTSSKSSRLIHGGVRYLETAWEHLKRARFKEAAGDLRFVFVSLRESRLLARLAPELVRPIELVIPIYEDSARGRWTTFAGAFFYYLLARLSGNARTPRILSKKAVLEMLPGLLEAGLTGGIAIWDRFTDDRQLVLAVMRSAERHGARTLERAQVTSYRWNEGGKNHEISVRDKNGDSVFRSRHLVDASGPWVDKTRRLGNENGTAALYPVAGSHLTVRKFAGRSALLRAGDGRLFFVINSGELCRVGTTERLHKDPDTVAPTEEEMNYLLAELNRYFPQIGFDKKSIVSSDAGVRPLALPERSLSAHDVPREHRILRGSTGVLHVLGVKLTDHRRAAEKTVDLLTQKRSSTRHAPL